jgi:hypothetical protein
MFEFSITLRIKMTSRGVNTMAHIYNHSYLKVEDTDD